MHSSQSVRTFCEVVKTESTILKVPINLLFKRISLYVFKQSFAWNDTEHGVILCLTFQPICENGQPCCEVYYTSFTTRLNVTIYFDRDACVNIALNLITLLLYTLSSFLPKCCEAMERVWNFEVYVWEYVREWILVFHSFYVAGPICIVLLTGTWQCIQLITSCTHW